MFVNTYNKTDVAAPFGGFKQSGFGKDLGKLYFYFIFTIEYTLLPSFKFGCINNLPYW